MAPMNSVRPVSWRDMGYARLSMPTPEIEQRFKEILAEHGYESKTIDGSIWLRLLARKTGAFPRAYAKIVYAWHADAADEGDVSWLREIDNTYVRKGVDASFKNPSDAKQVVERALKEKDHVFLYRLASALSFCPVSGRPPFMRECFFPAFRQRFPNGAIIFVSQDYAFEKLALLSRMGNYAQVNGSAALMELREGRETTRTLDAIQIPMPMFSLETFLEALLGNFMPLMTHYVGGFPGCVAVYLLGNPGNQLIKLEPFPRSMVELLGSNFFFHGETPDIAKLKEGGVSEGWRGRFVTATCPGVAELEKLLAFALEKFNYHLGNRIEVCNYVNSAGNIDFVRYFETYLSLDRIAVECGMIATSTASSLARFLTFAVLDKYQELVSFDGVRADHAFHYMCTRPFLDAILKPALSKLPPPWDSYFVSVADRLYVDLYKGILTEGIGNKPIVKKDGIRVYSKWDKKQGVFVARGTPMPVDEFIGEYIRVLRNTHHGYLDENKRLACIGSLATGFLPDSFTQLPLLLLLAELAAPEKMSGHHWLDQSKLILHVDC